MAGKFKLHISKELDILRSNLYGPPCRYHVLQGGSIAYQFLPAGNESKEAKSQKQVGGDTLATSGLNLGLLFHLDCKLKRLRAI